MIIMNNSLPDNKKTNPHILTQEQLLLARAAKCGAGNSGGAGPMRSCSSNQFH